MIVVSDTAPIISFYTELISNPRFKEEAKQIFEKIAMQHRSRGAI